MPLKPINYKSRLDKIKTDPASALNYSLNVLQERWPEAEPYILKSPKIARTYAVEMFPGERWPQLENLIINDAELAYKYALFNLDKRWPEAEPTIMKDAEIAYYYAINVLKKRWPKAEKMILKSAFAAAYKKNFSLSLNKKTHAS